jgi:hypothetical protein
VVFCISKKFLLGKRILTLDEEYWYIGYFWGFDLTYEELKPFNWNDCQRISDHKFWSYLWGIETCSRRIGKSSPTEFWSYLWGIETILDSWKILSGLGFDLTYEELKHFLDWTLIDVCNRFDLTYEEWNPVVAGCILFDQLKPLYALNAEQAKSEAQHILPAGGHLLGMAIGLPGKFWGGVGQVNRMGFASRFFRCA